MRLCIAGDSGLLGQALTAHFGKGSHEILGLSSSDFPGAPAYRHERQDILKSFDSFTGIIDKFKPDLLINCIALVDLAACETNESLARQLNTESAGRLAKFASSAKIPFIHISTDQVFDGKSRRPYREDDKPSPQHVYGRTKLEAEEWVRRENPQALIIRTNIVGFRDRESKPVFAEWLCNSLKENKNITLAEDFVTSSLHAGFLADFIDGAVHQKLSGLYHIASHDAVSKYDFGRMLCDELGYNFLGVTKGNLKDLNLKPERPPNNALDVTKIEKTLGRNCASTRETITRLANDFKQRLCEEVS